MCEHNVGPVYRILAVFMFTEFLCFIDKNGSAGSNNPGFFVALMLQLHES